VAFGNLYPLAVVFYPEADCSGVIIVKRIELGDHFQDVVVNGVKCEADNFVPGDFGNLHGVALCRHDRQTT